MLAALRKRLKNIEAQIAHHRNLRDAAKRENKPAVERMHERKIRGLTAEKERVEDRIRKLSAEGRSTRPDAFKKRVAKARDRENDRLDPKEARKKKGPFWKRSKQATARQEDGPQVPEKPKGVVDPYAKIKISRANAKKLLDYYMRRVRAPLISKKARAYFSARANVCSRVLRGGGGKKIVQLQSQAAASRAMAAKAKVRKDYAMVARLTEQADNMDRQAQALEAREGSEGGEGSDWTPEAAEGTTAPKAGSEGKDVEAPEDGGGEEETEISTSESKPWYKSPVVWIGVAAVAAIAVFARPKGGFKFAVRGPRTASGITFRPGRPGRLKKKTEPAAA
jgi:hypothetical protein